MSGVYIEEMYHAHEYCISAKVKVL